jgi:hypothetical protein
MDIQKQGIPVSAPPEEGWRLVCHTCGRMFEKNTAPAMGCPTAGTEACCTRPHTVVHNLAMPCNLCTGQLTFVAPAPRDDDDVNAA